MKIPAPSSHHQPRLFDLPITNVAQVRNIVGELAERLTCFLTRGVRYKTNSQCQYCPDVKAKGCYIESKAVGKTKEVFIYQGRLEKDLLFSQDNPLIYCIWHHNSETKYISTEKELITLVLSQMKCVYLVPFMSLYTAVIKRPLVKLNSKYYGNSDTPLYGSGYRMRLKLLEQECVHSKIEWEVLQPDMIQKMLCLD